MKTNVVEMGVGKVAWIWITWGFIDIGKNLKKIAFVAV